MVARALMWIGGPSADLLAVMRRVRWSVPPLPFVLVSLLAATWAHADEGRLARGEILVASRPVSGRPAEQEVVLQAVIDAPPAAVWHLVSNCRDFSRTLPRILASQEISRRGDRVVCRVVVDMPFPYADVTEVTEATHTVTKDRWRREWRLVSGDFRENRGSWELRFFAGDPHRTLLEYHAAVVPTSWVPGWIRRAAQRRTLPQMIERLRELVKKQR
jgi:ribosome-associated toxin RatA of RatAB toxin-antitoxin module